MFKFCFILFLLFSLLSPLSSDSASTPCFLNSQPCYLCPYTHFFNDLVLLPSNLSDCQPKKSATYRKLLILADDYDYQNALKILPILANTSGVEIYPDFLSALKMADSQSKQYFSGEIDFLFLGEQFTLNGTFESPHFFRRSNLSLNFRPVSCELMNLSGCLNGVEDSRKPRIVFSEGNEDFALFIANFATLENIDFSLKGVINNYLGFFTLEQIVDDPLAGLPALTLINCSFSNFSSSAAFFVFLTKCSIFLQNIDFSMINTINPFFDSILVDYSTIFQGVPSSIGITLNLSIENSSFVNFSEVLIEIDGFLASFLIKNCSFENSTSGGNALFGFFSVSQIEFRDCLFRNLTVSTLFEVGLSQMVLNHSIFSFIFVEVSLIFSQSSGFQSQIVLLDCNFYELDGQNSLINIASSIIFLDSVYLQVSIPYVFEISNANFTMKNTLILISSQKTIIYLSISQSFLDFKRVYVLNPENYKITEQFLRTGNSLLQISELLIHKILVPSIFILDNDRIILENSIFQEIASPELTIFERDVNYQQILINNCSFLNNSLYALLDSVRKNSNTGISFSLNHSTFLSIDIHDNYILRVCCCQINITDTLMQNLTISHESAVIFLIYFDYKTLILINNTRFLNCGFNFEPSVLIFGYDYALLFSINTQSLAILNSSFMVNDRISLKGGFLVSIALGTTKIIIKNSSFIRSKVNPNASVRGLLILYAKSVILTGLRFVNLTCSKVNSFSFLHQNGVVSLTTSDGYAFNFADKRLLLSDCGFFNCSCIMGGSITLINYHKITIFSCIFYNSTSVKLGGHIAILGSTLVVISKVKFVVSASSTGSAFYIEQAQSLRFEKSVIADSLADLDGAIYLKQISIAIFDNISSFQTKAFLNAAGIYSDTITLIIRNSHLKASKSTNEGGALWLTNSNMVSLINVRFCECSSFRGGTIFLDKIQNILLKAVMITNSRADTGAAIYFSNVENVMGFNLSLMGNEAESLGVLYSDSIFEGQKSVYQGLYCAKNKASQGSCFFSFSRSSFLTLSVGFASGNVGSTIQISSNRLSSQNIVWFNNTSDDTIVRGNMVYMVLIQCPFIRNSAKESLIIFSSSQFSFLRSQISSCNQSSLLGRFLYFQDSDLMLSNSSLSSVKVDVLISGDNAKVFILGTRMENLQGNFFFELGNSFLFISELISLNNKGTFVEAYNIQLMVIKSRFSHDSMSSSLPEFNLFQKNKNSSLTKKLFFIENVFINCSQVLASSFSDDFLDFLYFKNTSVLGQSPYELSQGLLLSNILQIIIKNTVFERLFYFQGAAIQLQSFVNTPPIILIHGSSFLNCSAAKGAAIFISVFCKIEVLNSSFIGNLAFEYPGSPSSGIGASLLLDCTPLESMNYSAVINNSIFALNFAENFGPTLLSNLFFSHSKRFLRCEANSDGLGVSTYLILFPKSIRLQNFSSLIVNETNFQILSGSPFTLILDIIDTHNQRIVFDNISDSVFLPPPNEPLLFLDNQVAKSQSGELRFPNMLLKARSNQTVTLRLVVKFQNSIIDLSDSSNIVTYEKDLTFFLRACLRGEIVMGDYTCQACPSGSFSLIEPMEEGNIGLKCKQCPENAFCPGGDTIIPLAGYWRFDTSSSKILKCIVPDTCLGGEWQTGKEGGCLVGHEGNLCYDCSFGYGRLLKRVICRGCDELKTIVLISLVTILLVIFLYILIMSVIFLKNNGRIFKSESNRFLIVLKIALNHFQDLTLMSSIDVQWPLDSLDFFDRYKEYFALLEPGFFLNGCVISYFLKMATRTEMFILKKVVLAIFPILMAVLVMTAFVFQVLINKFLGKSDDFSPKFLSKFKIAFITSFFLFYPLVIRNSFDMINCIALSDDHKKLGLYYFPDMLCWEPEHLLIFHRICLPSIIFWAFIMPFLGFFRLKLKKELKRIMVKLSKKYRETKIKLLLLREKFGHPNEKQCNTTYSSPTVGHLSRQKVNFSENTIFRRSTYKIPTENMVSRGSITKIEKIRAKFPEIRKSHFFNGNLGEISLEINETKAPLRNASSFLFFSTGYRIKFIYWEFVNFTRKFCLIATVSLNQMIHYSTVCILVLLIVFIHFALQMKFAPYQSNSMNKLQSLSSMANLFTIFGINFLAGRYPRSFTTGIAVLVIFGHLFFLLVCIVLIIKQKIRKRTKCK